jgi:hypothetical protein
MTPFPLLRSRATVDIVSANASIQLHRRLRLRIPNPAMTIITALAGSGTLDVGTDNPLATAKASKAATSPADTSAPLTP